MNPKIEKLVKQFAKLPRVGGRAAQRIVLGLLQDKTGRAAQLALLLHDAAETIRPCPVCGCLTDCNDSAICEFCSNASRSVGQICIVRDLGDVWTIEKAGVFRGRYHILGGLLSGAAGTMPEDLNIATLLPRIKNEKITEIIFVLPNTVEGKTTQHYVKNELASFDIEFTELASGVPLGGDLDYIDDGTLSLAFGRREKI
ncbi:MAG: recombination mediator RecR [Rickettsiales bacterium]|jgi:recombination protein RecR|nr:recombination mediator RecR [Rickettsiales bacterium]